jgi:hypothetical protein
MCVQILVDPAGVRCADCALGARPPDLPILGPDIGRDRRLDGGILYAPRLNGCGSQPLLRAQIERDYMPHAVPRVAAIRIKGKPLSQTIVDERDDRA